MAVTVLQSGECFSDAGGVLQSYKRSATSKQKGYKSTTLQEKCYSQARGVLQECHRDHVFPVLGAVRRLWLISGFFCIDYMCFGGF